MAIQQSMYKFGRGKITTCNTADAMASIQAPSDSRHCFFQFALGRADPKCMFRPGNKETRAVRLARPVFLFRDCPCMIGGFALAWFAVERAPAMTELRQLECCPVVGRQLRDQACNHAGLTHIPRVSADDNDRHSYSFTLSCPIAPGWPGSSDIRAMA